MKIRFTIFFSRACQNFQRYPSVLAMALLAAVCFMPSGSYGPQSFQFVFVKCGIVASLGISLLLAVKIFEQRTGKGFLAEMGVAAFLVALYFILPAREVEFTEPWGYLLAVLFILSHLMVSFIGFTGRNRERQFWQFNINVFINAFLTAVFTGVLTGGVQLALLAADRLFELDIPNLTYRRSFSFLTICGSVFIFTSFAGKGLRHLERPAEFPQILKFFTQFILIPLLLLYLLILYFYIGKIGLERDLPRGWVAYLVLIYSIVGLLALLLVHPLKNGHTKSWVKMFSQIFYFSLLPLLVLLFVAIFTRILEYGYTEPRYYVLVLAVWLTIVAVYFIFRKKTTIKFIPVSLFVASFLSVSLPYLNARAVAIRSQRAELQKILTRNKLLDGEKINFRKTVADSTTQQVANQFRFLAERRAEQFAAKYLPSVQEKKFLAAVKNGDNSLAKSAVLEAFSNVRPTALNEPSTRVELISKANVTPVGNYEYVLNAADSYAGHVMDINGSSIKISAPLNDNNLLSISIDDQSWDVTPVVHAYLKKYSPHSGRISVDSLVAEKEVGAYLVKIVFRNIVAEKKPLQGIYFTNPIILLQKRKP